MILIDSNILMYAAGAEHPNKKPSLRLLERIVDGDVDAAVDAEVLQEILHRYRAIRRWPDGRSIYDATRRLLRVIPITVEILDEARGLLDRHEKVSARDALHAAAARLTRASAICSYDRDFDVLPGLKRLEPQQV